MLKQISTKQGSSLDILVNSARCRHVGETGEAEEPDLFEVHFFGPAALPHLRGTTLTYEAIVPRPSGRRQGRRWPGYRFPAEVIVVAVRADTAICQPRRRSAAPWPSPFSQPLTSAWSPSDPGIEVAAGRESLRQDSSQA